MFLTFIVPSGKIFILYELMAAEEEPLANSIDV